MIKRTLYFGNPAYLSLYNAQLLIRLPQVEKNELLPENFKKEAVATIPVEDIGIVVLDHQQITITHALIASLLENNTAVITCNSSHHPTGLLLALSSNTIQNERYRSQLDASEPLKKQLWMHTVSQKIKNQATHLETQDIKNNYLVPLYKNVKSGDSDNYEATAAAYYWGNLFNNIRQVNEESDENKIPLSTLNGFRRHREGQPPNHYFNYAYAILRATMARSIVGAGLLPTLGLHHANRYNAYCLADDLMEPYRPFADLVVMKIIKEQGIFLNLTKEIKTALLGIVAMDVTIDGEKSPLMVATQRTAVSIVKCFDGEIRKPVFPEF